MTEFTVDREHEGIRLDRFILKNTQSLRNTVQKLIRKGDVRVNGVRIRQADHQLNAGDTVRIYGVEGKGPRTVSFNDALEDVRVLYEDDVLLVVDKPPLLASQPMKGNPDSLSERVKNHLRPLIEENGGRFIPAPVNRLDFATSGIVLCAKTPSAARELSEMLREERIEKHYYALCAGECPGKMRLEDWAVRDRAQNIMRIVPERREDAVRMLGIYTPLAAADGFTLMDARIITGKTHQIRCQLSGAGYPLINDAKYGDPDANRRFRTKCPVDRMLLHCYEVAFPLWYSPGSIRINCPVPEDMLKALSAAGLKLK